MRAYVLPYLLCGAVFVLWQSRRWWFEGEKVLREHGALVTTVVMFIALPLDLLLWPRSLWIWWRHHRKPSP